ncbi:MAG: hypothetical protein IPL34_06995 [Thiofilum sp.]|uniref:hypothetical protein n=1 Tax=Thiofilum sp. TaxID=2212733 RepID=UPI0025D6F005|nr:hypothetical protein [Thiofilum sp.]MBK8453061.1 hypothetical protein [Thiofilum sp.]
MVPTDTSYTNLIPVKISTTADADGWGLAYGTGVINGQTTCRVILPEKDASGNQIILNDGTADGAPLYRCDAIIMTQ